MVINFTRRICNRIRNVFCSQQGLISEGAWKLVPLTSKFLADEHGAYVTAIEAALADVQIRNIALSGNYGVGKSSILREVARRQESRVVELSLSTLTPIEASQLDHSVPVQAQPHPTGDRQTAALPRVSVQDSWLPLPTDRALSMVAGGRNFGTAGIYCCCCLPDDWMDGTDCFSVCAIRGFRRLGSSSDLGRGDAD